jgi:DNA-directed RNA polymerase subunit L
LVRKVEILRFIGDRRLFKLILMFVIMEIKIIKDSKDEIEFQVESLTIAEILRDYLNKDSAVIFAAWKREHPTEVPMVLVKTKGKSAKKAISDAVNAVTKDLDKAATDFKKLK